MSLLITGATGFIGKRLISELNDYQGEIFIIVREHSIRKAISLFKNHPRVQIIIGDITNINVLDDDNDLKLLKQVKEIIHLAGKYDIEMNRKDSYIHNIVGTQNIINLMDKIPSCERFHLISSFSVVGTKKLIAGPDDFANKEELLSNYSYSKMVAEKIARKSFQSIPHVKLIIYRPGIVIPSMGDKLDKIDGPFYFIQNLVKYENVINYLPSVFSLVFPYAKEAYLPLITVDSVVDFICSKINQKSTSKVTTSFYITGQSKQIIYNFMKDVFFVFEKNVDVKPIPRFIGRKFRLNFKMIPQELVSFGYFETKLYDQKTPEESQIIEKRNKYRASDMIRQVKDFVGGVQK